MDHYSMSGNNERPVVMAPGSSQVHRDLGALWSAHKALAERVRDSESRVIEALSQVERRIAGQVADIASRVALLDDKLSALANRVNKVLWIGAGGGLVLGLAVGWRPVLGQLATLLGH